MRQQWLYPSLGLDSKIALASLRLVENRPYSFPYWGCFSGGKDSVVIKHIAEMTGVWVEWHYNFTGIDPPEVLHFMREHHGDVIWHRPKVNFFKRAAKKSIPTRRSRWCCAEYKERTASKGATLILGVRGEESPKRAIAWQVLTNHRQSGNNAVSPIVDWSEGDVWKYIREYKLPYCKLYDEGFKRIGCVGCPIANTKNRIAEFRRWPSYERLWKKMVKANWDRRAGTKQRDGKEWFGSHFYDNWQELWNWWLNDESLPKEDDPCQGTLELWS